MISRLLKALKSLQAMKRKEKREGQEKEDKRVHGGQKTDFPFNFYIVSSGRDFFNTVFVNPDISIHVYSSFAKANHVKKKINSLYKNVTH